VKALLIIIGVCIATNLFSQFTGINKTNPAHPLDVNGNVNVDGKILLNNTLGQAGQVLRTNSTGETVWANFCDYTYAVNFTQNSDFIVPAGVTRIAVELWGAGGGGSSGGGGAAGMYVIGILDVTPGSSLTVTLGAGGAQASTNPGSGGTGTGSTVAGSGFITLEAAGGLGAFSSTPGYAVRYGTSGAKYIQVIGQSGDANTTTYAQKNSTTFVVITKYGDGGAAGPEFAIRSQGQTRITNENTALQVLANSPTFAPFPGGGGGGGTSGQIGGNGMVIIRY